MRVFIDTLGCPKNQNDSDIAKGILESAGHSIAAGPEDADVIIVNTCGFIEDAKRESISEIIEMSSYREQGKKLVASGCLVQRYAAELADEMPEIDAFVGVNDYERLPELLNSLIVDDKLFIATDGCVAGTFERQSENRKVPDEPYTAYLRIAEGCNKACSYCAIPSIRGPYRSRTEESIVKEAENLAAHGCKELVLIAEDTGYYGIDLYGERKLPELLKKLCRINGIEWIRIMYCYDDNISDELIEVMASETKICHYIDIPLQHASDNVLRRMNRRSRASTIRETVAKLRNAMPDIAIRTTMIVGFPGETEEDMDELLELVEEARFERLGAFRYSKEEGTAAALMEDQIDPETAEERLDRLMLLQMEISRELNERFTGKVMDVIVDGMDEDGVSCVGRTRYDAPEIDDSVIFTPLKPHDKGDIVKVKIVDTFDYDLLGNEVDNQDESAQ